MDDETAVFHMMGQPQETRHLLVHNEQAVISPSWSIHAGVGTKRYTFIWGMVGENRCLTIWITSKSVNCVNGDRRKRTHDSQCI